MRLRTGAIAPGPEAPAPSHSRAPGSPVPGFVARGHSDEPLAPDFIVIGTMKGGTTALYRYLAQFPDIGLSRIKETDYFVAEKNFGLGPAWYRQQFSASARLIGEVSPNYTKFDLFPGVPERIARVAPNVRLIFIARDPVARFASHYRHSWTVGHMRVRPEDLLASGNGRHMISCSSYAAQIGRYRDWFDPRQFLFLDFDVLRTTPQAVCDELALFLGMAKQQIGVEAPANTAEDVARIPGILQRAARTRMARRFDRYLPPAMRMALRRAFANRRPDTSPVLGAELLQRAADLLRDDATSFRYLSGKDFAQWRV
ncbi:MAG: sulfotransferase domain-containing protein [Defluviimonas sp.]|uniref:sulfotransferase domain-containing protein n=1 Tax=Albidovulum sp. TaxID=1872424 RepID=UPI002A32E4B9|nr:sulfotransferase domain-containing protein [Defluviimonas sp.]